MRRTMLLVTALLLAGCTRSYYRNAADRETYPIIAERMVLPPYDIGRIDLTPAPQSRLFDPYSPDRPPKPPDDPVAARYMERPGGMKGARGWYRDGVVDRIEPAGWEETLQPNESGVVRLDQDRAVEIALLNSREYQTALEAVYLQALGLTLDRYEFDLHWFFRTSPTYTHFGSGSFPTETNTLTVNSDLGFSRKLAAGGQLLVDFANSIVYEYVGGAGQIRSNLGIGLVQPLLRNFGRYVRLETLTQSERDVLYAVRDFARFRKRFWADVAVENGGYLDLLLFLQTLRNNEANEKRQQETYRLYQELFRGGRASVVEVDQFFQSLQAARLSVVDARAVLESSLDSFKLRLGLPPRLPVELDDSLLNQFIFVDPGTEKLRDELEAFQKDRLKDLGEPPPVQALERQFEEFAKFSQRVPAALENAIVDLNKWGERLERPGRDDDDEEQRDRIRATYAGSRKLADGMPGDLKKIDAAIVQHRKGVTEKTRKEGWENLTEDVKILLAQLDTIITLQTQARTYLIELPQINVQEAEALTFAKENRLVLGVTPGFLRQYNIGLAFGRGIDELDELRYDNVVVLGAAAAEMLFPTQNPIGRTISLEDLDRTRTFTVIGITEPKILAGGADSGDADFNRVIFIPFTTDRVRFGREIVTLRAGSWQFDRLDISQITVSVDDVSSVSKTAAVIQSLLDQYHPRKDVAVVVPLDLLQKAEETQRLFTLILGSIAGIALVVGGIGIMNIMLATVTERTREIGIRRALGAKRRDIAAQFLAETLALTCCGGVLGIGLGLALAHAVSSLLGLPTIIRLWSPLVAFAVSVLVGLLSGLYPARRAAFLDPIEALRNE